MPKAMRGLVTAIPGSNAVLAARHRRLWLDAPEQEDQAVIIAKCSCGIEYCPSIVVLDPTGELRASERR